MTPVILGDSHSAALVKGARTASSPLRGGPIGGAGRFFNPFFEEVDGDVRFTNEKIAADYEVWKERTGSNSLCDHPGGLIVTLGLGAPVFYGQAEYRTAPHRHLSDEVLAAVVQNLQAHILRFYDFCIRRRLLYCAVAGPAPQARHRAVKAMGVPAVLRMERAFQAPIRNFMASNNIPVIDLPETKDEQGLLLPDYAADDWSHANVNFGALAVRKIEALARKSGAPPQ